MAGQTRNVVFFLGAGFSAVAGLPTMAGFGKASNAELASVQKQGLARRRHKGAAYVEAGMMFEAFQRFCEKSLYAINADINNMEQVFCMAEAMQEAKVQEISLSTGQVSIEILLRNIRTWLWKIYHQNPSLQDAGNQKHLQKPYRDFLSIIREKQLCGRTAFLTTNYDLVLEGYAWKERIPFHYGQLNSTELHAGLGNVSYVAHYEDSQALLVLKLHGSVNFFAKSDSLKLGIVTDVWQKGDPAIGKSRPPTTRPSIFAYDAEYALRNKYGEDLGDPGIVPPTYAKLRGFSWLQCIWAQAFNAVCNAEKIIFIGYSIPESDGFLRAMIGSALASRNKPEAPRICVFDPNCDGIVGTRYKDFFKHVELFNQGFEEAVPTIKRLLDK
jgi:hypothetical protein